MKKYQLIEKFSTEAQNADFLRSAVSTRFFFRKDDASCFKLDAHIDYMLFNGITEMDSFLAERETDSPYFFVNILEKLAKSRKENVVNCAKAMKHEMQGLECVNITDILTSKQIDVLR